MIFTIHRFETCSSTNDVVRELALEGAPEGTAVVAAGQTAGRGTKGRAWHSPAGRGLYLSILLRPASADLSLLPLAAGLAVRAAIRDACGLDVRLRWPNDIIVDGRKLGGILCESRVREGRPDFVVLGLGLNVNQDAADFPEDLRASAASLKIAARWTRGLDDLLDRVLAQAGVWLDRHSRGERETIVRAFDAASVFARGEALSVRDEGAVVRGVYEGIDVSGALLLRTDCGVRRITSAENVTSG
jgi:BirA family biotin operon repressor/biotin-[acetyl-CoA-carboxylase] ligase